MTYSRVSVFTFTCCAYRKLGWAKRYEVQEESLKIWGACTFK